MPDRAKGVLKRQGPAQPRVHPRAVDSRLPESSSSREISAIAWYHSIRLGEIVTPGFCPVSVEQWAAAAIPDDLVGKAVLDVGAWDGFFSFEAERRGAARVLAIDALQAREQDTGTAGFRYAKAFLGSRVDFRVMDVMDLSGLDDKFDVVLFLGVYYHLVDPVHALGLLFDHLKPGGQLVMEGLVLPGPEAKLRLLRGEDLEPTSYCVATVNWLQACLRQTGFDSIEVVSGTWQIRSAMTYYKDKIHSGPVRVAYALANRLAWSLRSTRLPLLHRLKMYRVLIRAVRPG